jgi:hypothetical protein
VKVAIAEARLEVELDGKKAEATTDSNGRFVIRHKLPCGELRIKVFDRATGRRTQEAFPLSITSTDRTQARASSDWPGVSTALPWTVAARRCWKSTIRKTMTAARRRRS